MKCYLLFISLLLREFAAAGQAVPYGHNPAAGRYQLVHGVRLYYEVYGTGKPLLLIHGEIFHNFRKQVKATRYLMEIFVDRYPSRYQEYLKDIKQIHQLFGNIQDNLVLDKFIRKVVGKRAPTKLPTLYERIERNTYLSWNSWQPIQAKYRQLSTKQEFNLFLIQDIIHNLHG